MAAFYSERINKSDIDFGEIKKLPLFGRKFLKNFISEGYWFSLDNFSAGLKPVFIGINIFLKDLNSKKKEVD
jgi:hypothetical protein